MKYTFATVTMLGLLGSVISAPVLANNRHAESMLAEQGDLSMFYQALRNTGVAGELKENTEYSIFAPTNAAFARIEPHAYPCFYSTQCRADLAAILRNHIVPRNETIHDLSKWGGNPIPTLGTHGLYVEETFKNDYEVDGHSVLSQGGGEHVSVYRIDGVIASDADMAKFRRQPVADVPGAVTEKTVTTTYHAPMATPPDYVVPGGSSYNSSDDGVRTTTVTHTTTTDPSE